MSEITDADRLVAEAQRIVDDLFTNGAGDEAYRLVLMSKDGRDLGGWGRVPAYDRILSALQQAQAPQSNARTMIEWVRRIRTSKPFAKDEADLVELANEIERAAQPTTENYYDPVPPSDSPLRHAYTLDLAQLRDSRDQWEAQAKELEQAQARPEIETLRAERNAFGLALNDAGSTLTTTWNVAYWEPEKFTPAWFIEKYENWLTRLANGRHGEHQLVDAIRQLQAAASPRERGEQAAAPPWRDYVQHKEDCECIRSRQFYGVTLCEGGRCTCGLRALLAALPPSPSASGAGGDR